MSFPASREARDMELATTRFRVAVLPLDGELSAALLYRGSRKRCAVCGAAFAPKSNRGKYCPDCAGRMKYAAARKPSDSANATQTCLRI